MHPWSKAFLFLILTFAGSLRAETPACETLLARTAEVPLTRFVQDVLKTRNIHKLVDHLEATHGGLSFRVPMGGRTVYILQDRDLVRSVMRKESTLPFVNRNFDASHGHFFSINSVNTRDELWADLHNNLDDIFKNKDIRPLLDKYLPVVTSQESFNLNSTLEEYYLKVWGEYSFGPQDYSAFKATRDRLVHVLGKVFHENPVNRASVLGAATSRLNYWRYRKELKAVDQELAGILARSIAQRQGVFYELYERLKPKYSNAFQITLDNSFLAILVYDFIHIVMLDTLAHVAKLPDADPQHLFLQSRHHAFLYPFRFRIVEEDYDGFKKGDFVILNLQKTKLYFSAGARFCPGAGLFGEISRHSLEVFSNYQLRLNDPEQPIVRSPNKDLPFMLSSHDVTLTQCPFHAQEAKSE